MHCGSHRLLGSKKELFKCIFFSFVSFLHVPFLSVPFDLHFSLTHKLNTLRIKCSVSVLKTTWKTIFF